MYFQKKIERNSRFVSENAFFHRFKGNFTVILLFIVIIYFQCLFNNIIRMLDEANREPEEQRRCSIM